MALEKVEGSHRDYLLDDGFMSKVVESAEQAFWIRVGPVFTEQGIAEKPGIWVEYQEKYMNSPLRNTMLLSPEVWDALDKKVRQAIAEFQKDAYQATEASDANPSGGSPGCGCKH